MTLNPLEFGTTVSLSLDQVRPPSGEIREARSAASWSLPPPVKRV